MFELPPKSVCLAPPKSAISRRKGDSLNIYIQFLSGFKDEQNFEPAREELIEGLESRMAAIFDCSNPASPLAFDTSQTALILMDLQNWTIRRCEIEGRKALVKAKVMRDWALERRILVFHSVVDVQGRPPETCKGADRINKMLEGIAGDSNAAEEPEEVAFRRRDQEYIALKHPGHSSALRSNGAMELLIQHDIKSLILCGLSTSGCVLGTSLPAIDDGFVVSVIEDACADPVPSLHDTLMKSVIPSRCHVATAEEFVGQWDGKSVTE